MTTGSRPPEPEDFGPEYYRDHFGLDELRRFSLPWWSVLFYARLANRLLSRNGGRRMLEVGCGHGFVLARIDETVERFGIDISEYAISRARESVPQAHLFVADICRGIPDEVSSRRFDLILARYVLEHVPQPATVVAGLARLLAPGGAVLYAVPNTRSPGLRLKGERWFGYGDATHVSLLSPDEWLALTRDAGLVIERRFSDGLWDVPYVSFLPRAAQYALFSLPTIASVALAWPVIPYAWGENLIVIARRAAVEEES